MSNAYRTALAALSAEVRATEAALARAEATGDTASALGVAGRLHAARRSYSDAERALRHLDGPTRPHLADSFATALSGSFSTSAEEALGFEPVRDVEEPRSDDEEVLSTLFGTSEEPEPAEPSNGSQITPEADEDPLRGLFG